MAGNCLMSAAAPPGRAGLAVLAGHEPGEALRAAHTRPGPKPKVGTV